MSAEYQGKESGQNWEGSAAQSAQSESGKIQPKQLLILLVLSLSLAIIVIDATIVIVAQYQIKQDFQISLKDLEWITSLYALIFGSFLLSWGKLSDEFGRRRIFMAGISLFVVGSVIDGFSQNLSQILVIDATIVIVAQYQIKQDFQISLKDLEWITSLYALIFGSFLLSWGKLSDEFGRRRIFMAGISLFVVGSVIDGFSQNLSQILVGRIIQGFGAAMASPSRLSILTTTFTGKARGVAFGIWGATAGAAAVLGPVLGGYFTTYVTWRWAFFINIPIGAAALVGAAFVIRETRFKDPKYTTDYPGLIFITIGLASVLFGLIEAQTYGWLVPSTDFSIGSFSWPTSDPISLPLVSIITGIILLGAFTSYEIRRARNGRVPLFDFSLLRYKGFRYCLCTVAIVAMGEFGAVFIISIFLQTVKGLTAINAGLTFLPMAISVFICAPIAGILATRFGPKWLITTGMLLEAIALFSMSQIISISNPVYYLYPILVIYGAGVGLAISQVTSTVLMS